MTQAGPLRWRTGNGWLVLVGGASDAWRTTEAIDRNAIEAMSDETPIVFVPAAGGPPDTGQSFLERYTALSAPPGYVVPIVDKASASDPANVRRLAQAGLIYLAGGQAQKLIDAILGTPSLDAIAAAFASGAVIVGMCAGAIALAEWGVSSDEVAGLVKGWDWLPNTIVAPHYTAPQNSEALRGALLAHPDRLGLGIPDDTALALGPDGEVQTWGRGQIGVTLGSRFKAER
jgi:cyanophycinase